MSNNGIWSPEEDALVRELYPRATRIQIANMLGRTEGSVRSRCMTLGLNTKHPAHWTEAEEQLLLQWYASHANQPLRLDELARTLGRLQSNICRKARALGLSDQRRKSVERRKDAAKYTSDEERKAGMSAAISQHWAEHGHPRGALGMKHSEQSRLAIAAGGRARWADPNSGHHGEARQQQRSDAMLQRIAEGKMPRGEEVYSRTASGRRADLDNRYFRSSWEANYARYLNFLLRQGQIASWDYECKTFWFEQIKRGTRSYTPDFYVVFPDGHHEWHEVKGWMDQASRTRLDRMALYYPGEIVHVIGADWFRQANRCGLSGAIANWERYGKRA